MKILADFQICIGVPLIEKLPHMAGPTVYGYE